MKTMTSLSLIALSSLITAQQAQCAEYDLALGVAAFAGSSEFVDGDDSQYIVPIIEWSWQNWYFSDYRFGRYLAAGDNWYVSTSIGIEQMFATDRGPDLPELADVYSIDVNLALMDDWGGVELSIEQDISDVHQGYNASLSYGYEIQRGTWLFEPFVSLNYLPSKVVNHYYGVATYQASNGYSLAVGLNATYLFKPSQGVFIGAGYQQFSDDITDSTIVERKDIGQFSIGYIYAF